MTAMMTDRRHSRAPLRRSSAPEKILAAGLATATCVGLVGVIGARTVAAVKIWTRAGAGRCQGGFCGPRVVAILARELGIPPEEVTRHGGHSRLLVGRTKDYWFKGAGR